MSNGARQTLFDKVADNGFGDPSRRIVQAMDWFAGRLFVGTGGRSRNPLGLSDTRMRQFGKAAARMRAREVASGRGPDGATLWRHDPDTQAWDVVWRSPQETDAEGYPSPRDRNIRASLVFQAAGEQEPAVYFGVSAMDGSVRLIRSIDGDTFEEGPATGLGLGPQADVPSIRSLCALNGRVFTSPVGMARGRGMLDDNMSILPAVLSADHPFAAHWEPVSEPGFGDPDNLAINELAIHGGFLYAGTLNTRRGYQVWRGDLGGRPPYRWERILTDGGFLGPSLSLVSSMRGFGDALYVGVGLQRQGRGGMDRYGPVPGELLRIHADGRWDLITGTARLTPDGLKRPLSGLGPCFGSVYNRAVWHMEVHDDRLYTVGGDWRVFQTYLASIGDTLSAGFRERMAAEQAAYVGGFMLHASRDGTTWETLLDQGLDDNPETYAARILRSTPAGLFLGTASLGRDPRRGGLEIWRENRHGGGRADG